MFLGLCVLIFELFFLPKAFVQFLKMLQGLFIEGLVYGVGFHHREDDLVLMSLGSQGPCAGEMSKWGEHWLCIVLMDPTPVGTEVPANGLSVAGTVRWCTELVCP